MATAEMNLKGLIGQRFCLFSNKEGTLRYYGPVTFASGNWCGIELDEPDGDNDGTINNVCYFKCKEKHGMFCEVSEIATNLALPEKECYIIPSEYTSLGIQKKDLCEDPNFPLNSINFSETSSNEIPKGYHLDCYCKDSVVDIRLHKENTSPRIFEKVDYDSDESLGILPLSYFEDESEILNDAYSDIAMLCSLPFLKNSEPCCYDNENVIIENVFYTSDSLTEHIAPALIKETIQSFEERDKLNVTRVLHLPEKQDNLNITQNLNSPAVQNNLNETILLHNHTFEVEELKEVEKNANYDLSSPACNMSKTHPNSKCNESLVHKTSSSPKYASTPKHEVNYTFIFDEECLNSEKAVSPVVHFNKTIIKDNAIKKKTVFPENDGLDNENVLSMPNNDKHLNYQCVLNETFNNVYSHAKYRPSIEAALNTTVTFPEVLDKTFELKANGTYEITASDSIDVKHDKNVLNTTVSLSKEFEMFNSEQRLDCNTKVSDSYLEKNTDYGDIKDVSGNILDAQPIPKVDIEKGKSKYDKTQILNSTFEEKLDQLAELPQFMKASQAQKDMIKETRIAKLSQIAKVDNSSDATSSSKFTELDKKKTRKSVFSIKSNSTDTLNKQNPNRRKTFGSTSSQSDDDIVISQKLSRCAQKQYFSSRTTDTDYGDIKDVSGNILNAHPIPKVGIEKRKSKYDKRQILNSTFEEKLDQLAELPQFMKASQAQKDMIKETRIAKLSQIARVDNSSDATSSSKFTELDKKKTRKSVFSIKNNSTDTLNKQNPNRRKTFGSTSSQSDDDIVTSQKLSRCAQKQYFSSRTTDSQSLKAEPTSCNTSKKYPVRNTPPPVNRTTVIPVKRNNATQGVKNNHVTRNFSAKFSSNVSSSMHNASEPKVVKSSAEKVFKNAQLNETINLAHSMPDVTNTNLKKPQIPYTSFPKPEVPRIPKPSAVSRKSSLPVLRQSSSTVRNEEHNTSLSGASEKKVLSLRNISDVSGDIQSSYENRRQSLSGIKDALSDLNVKKFGSVPSSQTRKKDTKAVPSITSHNRPSSSHSNIPAPVSKKKEPEDKAKTGIPHKRNSFYNLR